MVALLVVLTLIGFVLADGVVQFVQARQRETAASPEKVLEPFSLSEIEVPGGLFLAPGHTWVALREDGKVRIGIDSLITGLTGKLSGFTLPRSGASMKTGEGLFSAQFGDRQIRFASPIAGTVTRINQEAAEEPPVISSSPYRHWICEIEPSSMQQEIGALRIGKNAVEWLQSELARMRSFLIDSPAPGMAAVPAMPDGGTLAAGALRHVDSSTVAQFETQFLKM